MAATGVAPGQSAPDQQANAPALNLLDTSQAAESGQLEKSSPRSIHGWKWALAYAAMLSTTFLFALDNTIVADIQPAIVSDFSNIELLPWIGTGFALGNMTILSWGKAYGIFNMKWIYLFNILLFEVGSAICGAAPNMNALILGRIIAGVGGSGMYSGTLTYVSILTNDKEKPAYLAGSTVMWGIGSVLGPVVGGAFASSAATWRWGFYINLVVGAVFAPVYIMLFPGVIPKPGTSLLERLKMMDWVMTVFFLAGSCCLTMAISFGGLVYEWDSGAMITLWVMTGVLLIASIFATVYHPGVIKENRLYPAHYFKDYLILNLQLQVFLSSGIILSGTYYVPLYFQFVRGDGPLDAGVRLLPLIIAMVVISMVNGILMPRLRYISPWYIIGNALAVAGAGLMCTINEHTENANVYGYLILIGAGCGCHIVAGFGIAQAHVAANDVANAVSAMTIAQVLGMVLFLSICGSTFQNTAVDRISRVLPDAPEEQITQLIAGTSSAAYRALPVQDRKIVIPEVTSAMGSVWLMYAVAAGISFLASLTLYKSKLGDGQSGSVKA